MGLVESVEAYIEERVAKIKGSIYELRALIEDFRMQAVGGVESAIELYESCIIPSLLSDAATWMEIRKEIEYKLDAIEDLFGRVLFQVPQSTPRLATRAALGLQGMRWRVWPSCSWWWPSGSRRKTAWPGRSWRGRGDGLASTGLGGTGDMPRDRTTRCDKQQEQSRKGKCQGGH